MRASHRKKMTYTWHCHIPKRSSEWRVYNQTGEYSINWESQNPPNKYHRGLHHYIYIHVWVYNKSPRLIYWWILLYVNYPMYIYNYIYIISVYIYIAIWVQKIHGFLMVFGIPNLGAIWTITTSHRVIQRTGHHHTVLTANLLEVFLLLARSNANASLEGSGRGTSQSLPVAGAPGIMYKQDE